ncbi:hypothetical protein CN141_29150, partial [Sinorhizobium meliloti]
WGRHHLGIRGRLFLGIGGRDHFGIRGRIASEFAGRSRIAEVSRVVGDHNWKRSPGSPVHRYCIPDRYGLVSVSGRRQEDAGFFFYV